MTGMYSFDGWQDGPRCRSALIIGLNYFGGRQEKPICQYSLTVNGKNVKRNKEDNKSAIYLLFEKQTTHWSL